MIREKGDSFMMKERKVVLILIMAAMALILAASLTAEHLFTEKRLKTAPTMANIALQPVETPPEQAEPAEAEAPEVYALFGVDTEEGDAGRSDCILLLSLEGDTLRMCSLARDTLVTLSRDQTRTKLGHAYAYGGPSEAMATINSSFGLDVTRYATVNFSQMADLVDLLGGAEVSLTRAEWDCLGMGSPYLGSKRLTGREALAYCRIRSIDNDDMRALRQQTVLASLVGALGDLPRSELPGLVMEGVGLCRTNLGPTELLRLGKTVLDHREGLHIEQLSIPGDSVAAWGGIREDGVWYYVYDLDRASEVLRGFFYGSAAETVAATE